MDLPSIAASPCAAEPEQAVGAAADHEVKAARLREFHLRFGVDPGALVLAHGMRLWFVSVVLDDDVHVTGLGFTRALHEYALGIDEAGAFAAVKQYVADAMPGLEVLKHSVRPASVTHPIELTFPEQVRRLDKPYRRETPVVANELPGESGDPS